MVTHVEFEQDRNSLTSELFNFEQISKLGLL